VTELPLPPAAISQVRRMVDFQNAAVWHAVKCGAGRGIGPLSLIQEALRPMNLRTIASISHLQEV
jgi:hypothetical protein